MLVSGAKLALLLVTLSEFGAWFSIVAVTNWHAVSQDNKICCFEEFMVRSSKLSIFQAQSNVLSRSWALLGAGGENLLPYL